MLFLLLARTGTAAGRLSQVASGFTPQEYVRAVGQRNWSQGQGARISSECGIHTAEAASALRSRKSERAAKEKPTPISQFFKHRPSGIQGDIGGDIWVDL